MTIKTVKDLINEGIEGRHIFVRPDFDVPLKDDVVTGPGRTDVSLSILPAPIDAGAKAVVMAHLGCPKGEAKPEFSLTPAAEALSERLEQHVALAGRTPGEDVHECANGLTEGDVLLLENVRFDPHETSKDEAEHAELAAELATLVPDGVFVPDGFGVVHRAQTSVFDVAKELPRYAGNLVQAELEVLRKVVETPEKPYTVVFGGPKVSNKLGVIEALTPKVDSLVIGGGMCFTFLVARGYVVGLSLLQEEMIDTRKNLLDRYGDKIVLPINVVVANKFAADAENKVVEATEILEGWMGLNIGPASAEAFGKVLAESKTVFWNDLMGVFETEAFAAGIREVAQAIIDVTTNNSCFSVVDGGDSAAVVRTLRLNEGSFSHISTGGDASLEFLEDKTLPGVSVLED